MSIVVCFAVYDPMLDLGAIEGGKGFLDVRDVNEEKLGLLPEVFKTFVDNECFILF